MGTSGGVTTLGTLNNLQAGQTVICFIRGMFIHAGATVTNTVAVGKSDRDTCVQSGNLHRVRKTDRINSERFVGRQDRHSDRGQRDERTADGDLYDRH